MSNFVSHASSALVEVPALPLYDNLRGEQAQRRFRGPPALIRAKYNELKSSGVQTLRVAELGEGIAWELIADFPGRVNEEGDVSPPTEVVLTDWTLEPIELQQSIWEFPPVVQEMEKLPLTDEGLEVRRLIHSDIQALLSGLREVPDRTDPNKTFRLSIAGILNEIGLAGLDRSVFAGLLGDLLRGVNSWNPESWNLRRTRRMPNGAAFRESNERVGRVLTPGSLFLEGFTDSQLATSLPSGGYWLKRSPFDRPMGHGQREVTTDFIWIKQYSRFLYGPPL